MSPRQASSCGIGLFTTTWTGLKMETVILKSVLISTRSLTIFLEILFQTWRIYRGLLSTQTVLQKPEYLLTAGM